MQKATKSYEVSDADVLNKLITTTSFPPSPSMFREESHLQKHCCGTLCGEGAKDSRAGKFLSSSHKCA